MITLKNHCSLPIQHAKTLPDKTYKMEWRKNKYIAKKTIYENNKVNILKINTMRLVECTRFRMPIIYYK